MAMAGYLFVGIGVYFALEGEVFIAVMMGISSTLMLVNVYLRGKISFNIGTVEAFDKVQDTFKDFKDWR